MTFLALRLLLGGWLKSAWAFFRANPILALCAVLALWAAVERHQAHKWQSRAEQCQQASQAAAAATKAMREAEHKAYQEKAVEADASHRAALAGVRSDTARYIASHRVQPSRISTAQPIGEADHAQEPDAVPSPLVVVEELDVQSAGDWQAYGVTCHDFLLSITQ